MRDDKARRMHELGRQISSARQAAGLTQRQVADRLGVTSVTVSRWERGAGVLDALALADLAAALDVAADQLLGRTPASDARRVTAPRPGT